MFIDFQDSSRVETGRACVDAPVPVEWQAAATGRLQRWLNKVVDVHKVHGQGRRTARERRAQADAAYFWGL